MTVNEPHLSFTESGSKDQNVKIDIPLEKNVDLNSYIKYKAGRV